jgi:predicted amidohydrolase
MTNNSEKKTLKVGVAAPHIKLCDVVYNVKECVVATVNAAARGVDLIVFPSLPLTGATCRDLFDYSVLTDRSESGSGHLI